MADKKIHPTVLIGLDGATYTILEPLMQDGVMPFLRDFIANGVHGVLNSTTHPLTPPAWTSLMTGQTPGTHGIYDFVTVEWDGDHPGYRLLTSHDIKSETIWSIAGRQECKVTSLNFPCMFPPPEINGFLMPGFVPWQYLPRAVHPKGLYKRLKEQPEFNARDISMDWDVERKALQGLPEEDYEPWIRHHIAREQQWFQITKFLMQNEPCELTAILFDGVDKLQHLCFALLDPKSYPENPTPWEQSVRELAISYFRELDEFIRDIVTMAGPAARVFMASDHGFSLAGNYIFYANTWLEQNGYLKWVEDVEVDQSGHLTLEGHAGSDTLYDWGWDESPSTPHTTAFALTASSNGIYIRRAVNPGDPGVPADEYEAFREKLRQQLLSYCNPNTGELVVKEVLTREQAYPGTQMGKAPDLTLKLYDHGFLSVLRSETPMVERKSDYGTHHPEGVFIAGGPGIRKSERIDAFSIVDITPTLLYSLGLPIPEDLEGRANQAAFEREFVQANPLQSGEPTLPTEAALAAKKEQSMSAEEQQQVMERLQALGYVE